MNKKQFLENFQKALFDNLNGTQKWWTKSLFHFTDITNAISILESGILYSRAKAQALKTMKNDNANDEVINITDSEYKRYARLYFGPSTPTQYNSEGIKPQVHIANNAHCPIPIMLVFDFINVFMHDDIKFTDGNLATNPTIYNNAEDLEKLNFNLIYHRSWFEPKDRDIIVNARHSEVLVKDELILDNNLKVIIVRSEAEKESLLYQLSDNTRQKYVSKIFVQPQTGIFINNWIYVNNVSLVNKQIHIKWHKCNNNGNCKNSYTLKIIAKTLDKSVTKKLEKQNWYPQSSLQKINLPTELIGKAFELTIYIDDIKAYSNLLGYEL